MALVQGRMNSLFQNRHFYSQALRLSREKSGAFASSYCRRQGENGVVGEGGTDGLRFENMATASLLPHGTPLRLCE